MAQHRRTSRLAIALLTVLTLLLGLLPGFAERVSAAELISLSRSDFVIGYPPTTVTLTGTDLYKFRSDTRVYLFDSRNQDTNAIAGVQVVDSKHLNFTLQPGLASGKYTMLIVSYTQTTVNLNVLTSYDPTNITVTPGANDDIRVDWNDPSALEINDIVIQYSLIDQNSYVSPVHVPRGVGTYTIKNLPNNKTYKIMIYATKTNGSRTDGVELTNGGLGYKAVDTTPPGDITNLNVSTIPNGFVLNWRDPINPDYPTNPALSDLSLITVQYAEHGTTNWSDGFVVAKGVQTATLSPMNTAKRYDFRFTKLDVNGNWNYQVDNHNGYGYTADIVPPSDVSQLRVSVASDTSAYITWYDPTATDFHHVNFYLKSPLSPDWILVGRADKGLQNFQLNGLTPGIDYTLKATSVDQLGYETSGTQANTFRTNSLSDISDLTNVSIAQEVSGGLQMTWLSDAVSSVNFNRFKMYYAPVNSTNSADYKPTSLSNLGTKTASLRDMPRGLYQLDMRVVDSFGLMQSLKTYNNNSSGYYVSGTGSSLPTEVGNVKVLATDGSNLDVTWDAATSNGSHVEVFLAERSQFPSWRLLGKVDKRNQRFTATGLSSSKDYFFKLVVFDSARNVESPGVIYDNSGYGYNIIGGDRYAPHEVTEAGANVYMNSLVISYTEPTDTDFNLANVYVQKMNSTDSINPVAVVRGSNGTTIRDLVPGALYTVRITTVDNYGNESTGINLNNNGAGYLIGSGSNQPSNEVRNAIAIPNTTSMTVRFSDPVNNDYAKTLVAIKKVGDTSYSSERFVNKGTNETIFTGLDSNQSYQVRLITMTSSGKASTGLDLGGANGISMIPISNVFLANVTPGVNRLNVSWSDPTTTTPTAIAVEVMANGKTSWSEPQYADPGTGFLVLNGLSDSQSYKVRITALRNEIGSPSILLDASNNTGSGPGFTPRDVGIAAAPSHLQQGSSNDTQVVTVVGRNTQMSGILQSDVTLYDQNNGILPNAVKQTTLYSSTRLDVRLTRNLNPGVYTLKVHTGSNGDLTTQITVQSDAPKSEISSLSTPEVTYSSSSFTMTLKGSGFTSNSRIIVDNRSPLAPSSYDDKTLTFMMPSGLLPGVHKVAVSTDGITTVPMNFTVHPFKSSIGFLNVPAMRNGTYHGEWNISNMDPNARTAKVILIIRRNGEFVEQQEQSLSFIGYESKKIKLDFGGANTPYANGPTQSISVQAFIVDANTQTPLSIPSVYRTELNL
ncbi:fibronectin type III domain-containing protein [Tumebacillus sp. ITR2]|uniref:Fibronectin type III domain-containing protein n=1 Tax=Tumebacillus amylolyticus TaxID=2801339 RepID=A0ABS1J8Q5_9BACL|nr:fibronectin type III domain-containing protein [Tumebacillus amylolyticus]MBL0386656.1 fibronectin type III domain-containing protein [Tumebacillus amylolyticus]